MALVLPFPPPTVIWEIDALWPATSGFPVRGRGATAPTAPATWIRGGPQSGQPVASLSGTPWMNADSGGEFCVLGGQSNGLDQNQFIQIFPAHVWVAQLPAGVPRAAEMRLWWWRARIRFVNPTATFGLLTGIGLVPYGGTCQWLQDTPGGQGSGIGFYGNGSGGLAWTRKAICGDIGPLAERTTVAWPRPLTDWTEVGFVIYSGGPGIRAQCVPVLDGIPQAALARAWGANGTGTGNPELGTFGGTGLMGFALQLMCGGAAQPGMRMHVREVRFRAGRFDVSGVELTS